jgi:hypothetical protein
MRLLPLRQSPSQSRARGPRTEQAPCQSVQGQRRINIGGALQSVQAMCLRGCFKKQPLKQSDGDAVPVLTSQDHLPFSAGLLAHFLAAEKGFRMDGLWCEVSEVEAQHLDSRPWDTNIANLASRAELMPLPLVRVNKMLPSFSFPI